MKLINHIKEGAINLVHAKMRSILALLGILVGTASVVAMVSGGKLATNEALKQFQTLGTDLLALSISDTVDENHNATQDQLSIEQANGLATADKAILDIAPYTQLYHSIQFNGQDMNGSVLGVTGRFSPIVHVDVEKGRFISMLDQHALFAVVGHAINQKIKEISHQSALGQQIQIGKTVFTIIGIAKPWPENSFVYANIDHTVMVPLLTSLALSKYSMINNIILRLRPDEDIGQIQSHLTQALQHVLPKKRIFFRSAKELILSMTKQNQIFTVFLGLIGSISLLVGGIGVMNIMLVSVVERRREIGIRRAVGAKRQDIGLLFLMEAVMLAGTGGTLGVIIGTIIAYVMALLWHWEFVFYSLPAVIGFSVSVMAGIFFGFYPAYQASQLDPIAALRSD